MTRSNDKAMPTAIIPATDGWYSIVRNGGNEKEIIDKEPIIAWAIEWHGLDVGQTITPITVSGMRADVILRPDGWVEELENATYDSLSNYMESNELVFSDENTRQLYDRPCYR